MEVQQVASSKRFQFVFAVTSMLMVAAAPLYGWQANAQTSTAVTEQEAAQLASAVFSGLERIGDIRKLDRRIFTQVPFDAPCEFLFVIPEATCTQLRQDERREYVYTSVNAMWQMFEHQMSLPTPLWFQSPPQGKKLDAADFFPDEVRHLLPPTMAVPPEALEGFRKRLLAGMDLEKALLEHRLRHDHVNQPSYRMNLNLFQDQAQPAPKDRFGPLDKEINAGSVAVFCYVRYPFAFFIAKEQGTASVVWLRGVEEDDCGGYIAATDSAKNAQPPEPQPRESPPGPVEPQVQEARLILRTAIGSPASNLSGSAEIVSPANGSIVTSSSGRAAVLIMGTYSATFEFPALSVGPIEAFAELSAPESKLNTCTAPATIVRHETTYSPGPPATTTGKLEVIDVNGRNGFAMDPCVRGRLFLAGRVDPQLVPWVNAMPLPNSMSRGDGTGLFFFDRALNSAEALGGQPSRLSFPVRALPISPSLMGPAIGSWKVFSPGTYSVVLTVNVGGTVAATATSTFTVK